MRYLLSFFVVAIMSQSALAQILEPVKWSFSTERVSDTECQLVFTAAIDDEWNVYSQFTSDDGPVPTSINFEAQEGIELLGPAAEQGHKKEGFDKLFETNVIKFLGDEDFTMTQKIKVLDAAKPISGYLTFMTCNDKTCLPPTDIDFSFDLSTIAKGKSTPTAVQQKENTVINSTTAKVVTKTPNATGTKQITATSTGGGITVKTGASTATTSTSGAEKLDGTVGSGSGGMSIKAVNIAAEDTEDQSQDGMLEPVKWTFEKKQITDSEYELIYTAAIDDEWNVYSQFTSDDGPVPTSINFEAQEGIELVGPATEQGHKKEGFDKLFETNVIKFLGDEDFVVTQKIKVTDKSKPISGYLTFMTCNDVTCLPPTDIDFDFSFGGASTPATAATGLTATADGKIDQQRASLRSTFKTPLSDCGEGSEESQNLWLLLIAGLLGGFAALMTPCVFPMIPITVSFFTKDTKRKGWVNGLIYGASIIAIYVTLGLLITVIFGPEALNEFATNWIANTIFFVIFIVFAFSFFGFYEITLPSSWTTKTDGMADKGGLLGIFFMAATLSLVSFSCTGPIVGTALVLAAKGGGYVGPFVVMLGFSAALALPFGLFAAFPAWLNSLPRSGSWMNSVKVVLGFLEIGFAFKFLSTADLTKHWGFLRYELFMLILILVAVAIALYLFGFIKFPHDSPIKKLSATRKVLATSFAALAVYLCFGFTINKDTGIYNSLWLTSGFSPPVNYNFFLEKGKVDPAIKAIYPSYTKCANNIDCFKDYFEGLAYAKSVDKPIFLDFTGHGCQNCRRTEDNIWVDQKVRKVLNDEVVLISLYVDDRDKLAEPFVSAADGKKKRTVGNQWADFQVVNFEQNSQPLYIMVTPEEEVITHPRGYQEGVPGYIEYLDCGLKKYEEL